jgi:hypothetical protein
METGTESPRPLLNSSASCFIAPFFGHTWVISEMLSSCSLSQDRATMIEQQTFAVLHNWFHHLFCVLNSMDCVSWIERNIIVFLWPFSGSFYWTPMERFLRSIKPDNCSRSTCPVCKIPHAHCVNLVLQSVWGTLHLCLVMSCLWGIWAVVKGSDPGEHIFNFDPGQYVHFTLTISVYKIIKSFFCHCVYFIWVSPALSCAHRGYLQMLGYPSSL